VLTGARSEASSRLVPRASRGKREGGEAGGFGGGHAEQPQHGPGELVDGGFRDAVGVPLAHPQQPEQAAGHRAERDPGIRHGEPARGLPARIEAAEQLARLDPRAAAGAGYPPLGDASGSSVGQS
jgi:hypothetical protein